MKKERLKQIASAGVVTPEDREFVRTMCDRLGVEPPKKTRCAQCWQDKAVELYNRLTAEEQPTGKLKPWVDVLYNGTRVNNATLTDKLEAVLRAPGSGFPKSYWNESDA